MSPPKSGNLRILAIEDQPEHVEILQDQLSEMNLAVDITAFASGEEALAYLARQIKASKENTDPSLPQLIFLDLFLAGENGIHILDKIKKDPVLCSIPVAVLSSAQDDESIRQSYRKGGVTFLPKPCQAEILKDFILQLQIAGLIKR